MIVHFFTSHAALADARLARERLRVSMVVGRSAIWDLNVKTGQERWFGDLNTLFGIVSDTLSAPREDFYRYLHPADRQHVSQVVTEAREKRSPYTVEFRSVHGDGTVRWISAAGEFQYSKRGDPVRMLGIAVDITDRKLAEQALLSSEEKFSRAFRESPVVLTLTSARDHRYLDVNVTFEEATHWRKDEVIGRTPFDINIWADPAEREEFARAVLERKTLRDFEVRYRRKDGSECVGLASADLMEIEGEQCILSAIVDITDRKRTEEALRTKEAELAEAQSLAHVGDWELSFERASDLESGNFKLRWSEELYRIHGRDPNKPLPSNLKELFEPESWQKLYNVLTGAMQTGSTQDLDLEVVRPDGTTRWVNSRGEVRRDSSGQIIAFRGASLDITDRKRAEQLIHHSEERLRHLISSSNDWVWEVDANAVYSYAGPQCRDILGYEPTEIVGKTPFDLMPPDEGARVASICHSITAERKSYRGLRNVNRHKEGHLVVLETNGVPILDADGSFRGYRGMHRDITERDRVEHALRESEQRFRLVANTAPVMLWMSGTDKRCNYFNRPWLEFTGRSLESQIGNGWADGVHPDDLSMCLQTYTEAFDQHRSFEMQYRLRRHDEQYRWVVDIGVPRFNQDGSFAGYIGSCIDITERKLAEESMASIGRRLIEAHEEERTRIGRELHDDINQRLALLAVELDRWRETLPSSPQLGDHVRQAQQRIHEIGKDVQSLSHRLHSSKLDYLGLVRAANSFCRELSEQSDVNIKFSHADVPRTIPKEVSLCLFRVLQEALQNAVKHSGVREFTVDLRGTKEAVELTVIDTGSGFDEQEAFTRQGLGLISMRERLQLVQGEFLVASGRGVGTTIRARVPRNRDELQAMAG
ncbi:MAG TPA: PAS domain S-box protein [Candidatus Sulfotelmatobacter sp.]